jgi:hypothetical protein
MAFPSGLRPVAMMRAQSNALFLSRDEEGRAPSCGRPVGGYVEGHAVRREEDDLAEAGVPDQFPAAVASSSTRRLSARSSAGSAKAA